MDQIAVRSLSIHADYQCRHSGKCCSTNWDVPVELPVYRALTDALAAGRLATASTAGGLHPFVLGPDLPEDTAAMFERTDAGHCVFHDPASRLCIVHRDLGAEALPATCRHFPRVAVHDRRGTSVALSHFCPTAASMLFREDVPLAITDGPAAFPPADYEGLEITDDDLPPLLSRQMLMDLEGYSEWERHMVSRCADMTRTPESVLATLARDAAVLASWKPGGTTLAEAVAQLPADVVEASPADGLDASLALFHEAITAVPDEFRPEPDEDGLPEAFALFVQPQWHVFRAPLNRYIAAKAFASWTAYQGRGVATIVRGIEAAVALVRVEASRHCRNTVRALDAGLMLESFRSADFILNHLAVGEDLAANWSKVEAI
jgi:hypothetical protein